MVDWDEDVAEAETQSSLSVFCSGLWLLPCSVLLQVPGRDIDRCEQWKKHFNIAKMCKCKDIHISVHRYSPTHTLFVTHRARPACRHRYVHAHLSPIMSPHSVPAYGLMGSVLSFLLCLCFVFYFLSVSLCLYVSLLCLYGTLKLL